MVEDADPDEWESVELEESDGDVVLMEPMDEGISIDQASNLAEALRSLADTLIPLWSTLVHKQKQT